MFDIDSMGMVQHQRVSPARRLNIERATLKAIHGIIVHQTNGSTTRSALDSYLQPNANGAHFLIDNDGTIYQTASLQRQTHHVGNLKARCLLESRCTPTEVKLYTGKYGAAIHRHEKLKSVPERFPSNVDSIGIELVGRAREVAGKQYPEYESATPAQNGSLKWLIDNLKSTFQIRPTEIFRHPDVSWKTPTEAASAQW